MSPMAASQAREEGPGHSAFPAPCLSGQEFAKPLVCKTEAPAVTQRKLGSGIFTPQLWKAVGLVPKQLEPTPVQCAALTTPKSAPGSARPPLPPPFSSSGGGRRLMSGSTFSGELSFGSVSSTGCVSIHMASCDINPKSLKSAAIMAFEGSAAEGSDASGALSDSTGVSPGHLHGGSAGVVTSGRPLGNPGRQRSLGPSGGSSLSREAGPVAAPVASAGPAAAAAAASPPYLQHVASGASHSSFGAASGAGCAAGGGAADWNVAAPGLATAPSLAARSEGGSSDTSVVYTGDLHECLLCGLKSCFPTGPATIRCSDCKGTMHRDCFIAHYQVVPGRRDWTYCPVHSQVLKNRLPAKPRPAAAPRRGPKDKDPRPQQQLHQRKRPRPDGGAVSDAAGDREFTAGPGFERVPSGSRSQRARRATGGGSAALAAAGMAAGGGGDAAAVAAAAGSGAFSAVASPASSDGGNGGAADAAALPPPQRRFVSSRGRESRPVRRQYDSDADADAEAATPRDGSGPLGASPASTDATAAAAACGASPMDTDHAAPSSPTGNSESGSAAEPDSPTAASAAARAGGRSAAAATGGKAGQPASSAGRSRSTARPQHAGPASPRGPTSLRLRAQLPHSPRAGNCGVNGSSGGSQQKGDDGGAGGRKAAARGSEASRGREQRPPPASPRARPTPKPMPAASAAPPAAVPAPAKTQAELNDEELAMLLHQELNAPSRRRGQRLPGPL